MVVKKDTNTFEAVGNKKINGGLKPLIIEGTHSFKTPFSNWSIAASRHRLYEAMFLPSSKLKSKPM